jgi:NAD(P)-dependent dehydrogenase (short-subunit alcohol dehydrogenase family)
MEAQRLAGKVVVITGASSGFGKGAARRFAEHGARLVLAARRGPLLEDLARECEAAGGQAVAQAADVSQRADVERIAATAVGEFGRIDVWVNNAGVGALGPFEHVPLDDHVKVIETNLLGTLFGSYLAYRRFLEQGAGVLINVASELGRHTVPYYASYVAAKHGVVGLSDSLRQEIQQKALLHVHVCTVMPTAHDTPFFDHAANYTGHVVRAPAPLHDPENVVETIVRLAQDPKDREIVGADGVVKILMKQLLPPVAEKMVAAQMHRTQMETAPPGPNSPGAVQSPIAAGTEVRAGRRDRR